MSSGFFLKLKTLWNRLIRKVFYRSPRVSTTEKTTGTQKPITQDPFKPKWLLIAEGEVGVKEVYGDEHNPRIIEYGTAVSLDYDADEIPWCAAFVNWVLKQSDIEGTNKALARSFLEWGHEIEDARIGAIAVLRRGTSSWQGHVGIVTDETDDRICLLGGNQSNKVGYNWYSKSKLLGYRWPYAEKA